MGDNQKKGSVDFPIPQDLTSGQLSFLNTPFLQSEILSYRVFQMFRTAEIEKLGDILEYTKKELLSWNGFGDVALGEVEKLYEDFLNL